MNSKTRILVVDDERSIRTMLVRGLSLVGYHADEAGSGTEALELLKTNLYDVIILDLLMPDIRGEEVMRQACHLQNDVIIIILTGNATLESAITAIKSEAVDYILKPASLSEIIETVANAVQTRRERQNDFVQAVSEALNKFNSSDSFPTEQAPTLSRTRSIIVVSPLKLNRSQQTVSFLNKNDQQINLTKGETEVLACLMTNADHPLTCRRLVSEAWQYDIQKEQAESIIRPYISRLRQKIEDDPKNPSLIRTIRKRGYLYASSNSLQKHSH